MPQIDMTVNRELRVKGIKYLKHTGHVMHHQFNIQLKYTLSTLY